MHRVLLGIPLLLFSGCIGCVDSALSEVWSDPRAYQAVLAVPDGEVSAYVRLADDYGYAIESPRIPADEPASVTAAYWFAGDPQDPDFVLQLARASTAGRDRSHVFISGSIHAWTPPGPAPAGLRDALESFAQALRVGGPLADPAWIDELLANPKPAAGMPRIDGNEGEIGGPGDHVRYVTSVGVPERFNETLFEQLELTSLDFGLARAHGHAWRIDLELPVAVLRTLDEELAWALNADPLGQTTIRVEHFGGGMADDAPEGALAAAYTAMGRDPPTLTRDQLVATQDCWSS